MENMMSITDEIYQELVDGLKTGLDWTHFLAEHKDSKGPTYNAIGRFFHDMEPKVKALGEVQAKLDEAGLKLDSLNQGIKEAEGSLAPLEGKKNSLDKQIAALESKLTEKSELTTHLVDLEKLGFDITRLSQLKNALTEIGAKHGLKGKEAVGKFFHDLKDYEAVLGAELLLEGLQTKIEEMNQALEKDGAKIEAAIDALKVACIKELKAMSEAVEKDLKAVTASEIGAIQAVGQEAGNQLNGYFAQIDQLLEKIFQAGQEFEKRRPELQKYERVKDALQSHAAEWKAEK